MSFLRNKLVVLALVLLVSVLLYLLLPAIRQGVTEPNLNLQKLRAVEGNSLPAMNLTVRTGQVAGATPVFYRETIPVGKEGTPKPTRIEVVFLHGQAFTSKNWEKLGTLAFLASHGYRAVALDLPGFGDTPDADSIKMDQDRVNFLVHFLDALELKNPVLVSPSMSGRFSLPFLMQHSQRLKGFIPIAPVGTRSYTAEQYKRIQTPTLIIYGEQDSSFRTQSLKNLRQLSNQSIVELAGAAHACYLDKTQEFHDALLAFLSKLK
ncbi:protein ABHD14A [Latimeria chalumnae]|uniref:Abhydrolase domain containing 14A n=1 Tax=Latimeria chalumnae TaxID=7897 RepID=H3AIW3_LATCH|nr:PREDICTED: alpha/beta hydrolase domain-containing protein 14A [Latimeria chalumnae]XP_005992720.1 PREDICTED: alpha/beta hydrolase domain-containing protein 14A [Latimeria chalumnae]|eukprot:XP_005992719.1 PREDICTED: alpha/beta hydrolase domain-containing protein 14A [Latimeria chalumnae]